MSRALKSRGIAKEFPRKLQCYSILTIALPDTHHGVTKSTRATDFPLRPTPLKGVADWRVYRPLLPSEFFPERRVRFGQALETKVEGHRSG